MKTVHYFKEITAILGVAVILTFLLSSSGFSQEKAVKKEVKGSVKIRIDKEESGKRTVTDTTFNLNDKNGESAYEIFMKEIDAPGGGHHERMKNIEVHLSDLGKLDSLDMDSLGKLEKTIRIFSDDGNIFRIEGIGDDERFDLPIPPPPPEPCAPPCFENEYGSFPSCVDEGSGNLLDVLRSISMNRVRNFSIKEKKHSTRIIIDVDRSPVLDRPFMHDRMIYFNNSKRPGRMGIQQHPRIERKVVIEKENENKVDK
jgi:hypothetical protein